MVLSYLLSSSIKTTSVWLLITFPHIHFIDAWVDTREILGLGLTRGLNGCWCWDGKVSHVWVLGLVGVGCEDGVFAGVE